MSEDEAKEKLAELLNEFPPGTLLHFVGDLLGEKADAVETADPGRAEQLRMGESALVVVGAGVGLIVPW